MFKKVTCAVISKNSLIGLFLICTMMQEILVISIGRNSRVLKIFLHKYGRSLSNGFSVAQAIDHPLQNLFFRILNLFRGSNHFPKSNLCILLLRDQVANIVDR